MEPLALLKHDLSDDDVAVRRQAAARLQAVASSLKIDERHTSLAEFLVEYCESGDDDEVLFELAGTIGECIVALGGGGQGAEDGSGGNNNDDDQNNDNKCSALLRPLQHLCRTEETVVRERACESAAKVIGAMTQADVESVAAPIVSALGAGDWFTAKVSGAALIAPVLARLNGQNSPTRTQLLNLFAAQLCADDTPMVRRAAAKHLGNVAAVVSTDDILAKIVPAWQRLVGEDNDSVRTLGVGQTSKIAPLLDTDASRERVIVPVIRGCANDRSWRVRLAMAADIGSLALAVTEACSSPTFASAHLAPLFGSLLQDAEPEVRVAAAKQIVPFCKAVPGSFGAAILPMLQNFESEQDSKVRVSVVEAAIALAPILGEDVTTNHLVPLVIGALNWADPATDSMNPDGTTQSLNVSADKLQLFKDMDKLVYSLDAKDIGVICKDVIVNLSSSSHVSDWRNRQVAVRILPDALVQLSKSSREEAVQFFTDDGILEVFLGGIDDPIAAVRRAFAEALPSVYNIMGAEWMQDNVIPKVEEHVKSTDTSYTKRISALQAAAALGGADKVLAAAVMAAIEIGLGDSVPNVVVAALKALGVCWKMLVGSNLAPNAEALTALVKEHATSSDRDVSENARAVMAIQS